MRRPLAAALLVVLVAVAFVVARDTRTPSAPPSPGVRNPGGYVASDVGLLATTGRPQLAEVFDYG